MEGTQELDISSVQSCWDCQHHDWIDSEHEGCSHPDQSLIISNEEIDRTGATVWDCKGLLPIVED